MTAYWTTRLRNFCSTGGPLRLSEAERQYLESHLDEVLRLVESPLSEEEFRRHPLIALLFSHGSRGWEDSLR